jgi:hypothetical protein
MQTILHIVMHMADPLSNLVELLEETRKELGDDRRTSPDQHQEDDTWYTNLYDEANPPRCLIHVRHDISGF